MPSWSRALLVGTLALGGLVTIPIDATAVPIVWSLNVIHSGGAPGSVTGSFIFDADTGLYSDVAITTVLPNATFDTSEIGGAFYPNPATATTLQLVDNFVIGANLGKPSVALSFLGGGLTNVGGVVGINGAVGPCAFASCVAITTSVGGSITGGNLSGDVTATPVASAVPEPASLLLTGAGLAGLGVRRGRKRRP